MQNNEVFHRLVWLNRIFFVSLLKILLSSQNNIEMKYSIITINYNNADGLRRTIESVVNQTYTDYEYLIIDGGSTDGSVNAIKEYEDKISYWVSEKDGGIYNAMNKGVKVAHGEYLIFMNSGDVFYNNRVLERIESSQRTDDIIVGRVLTDEGKEFMHQPQQLTMYFLYSSTIPHQGAFIKKQLLEKYPYDETLKITSDWKFFVDAIIYDNCSVGFVDIVVSKFDVDGVSTTHPEKTWNEKLEVLRTMLPLRVLQDYENMKKSECLTQTLTPQLRKSYRVDKLLYLIGKLLLKINNRQ